LTFPNLSTTTSAMSIWTNNKPSYFQIGILNTLEWEWRNFDHPTIFIQIQDGTHLTLNVGGEMSLTLPFFSSIIELLS
jgi:hypothetical protein